MISALPLPSFHYTPLGSIPRGNASDLFFTSDHRGQHNGKMLEERVHRESVAKYDKGHMFVN